MLFAYNIQLLYNTESTTTTTQQRSYGNAPAPTTTQNISSHARYEGNAA